MGGTGIADYHSFRILSAVWDPENPSGIVVKQVNRIGDTWFFEEGKIDFKARDAHQKSFSLGGFNVLEDIS